MGWNVLMPTPDFDLGRSRLVRYQSVSQLRKRPYLLRTAILIGLVALVVFLVEATIERRFAASGPASLWYGLHDSVFLPLYGALWVTNRPYASVWIVPAIGFLLLFYFEFATSVRPVRSLQRSTLRMLLKGSLGFWAMRTYAILSRHRGFGFELLYAVVATEYLAYRRRAFVVNASPSKRELRRLMELANLRWVLGPQSDHGRLSLLEVLALVNLRDPSLRERREWQLSRADLLTNADAGWEAAVTAVELGKPSGPLGFSEHMHRVLYGVQAPEVVVLGYQLLAAMVETIRTRDRLGVTVLTAWTRARMMANPPLQRRLMEVEAAIEFEFWAAQLEAQILDEPLDPLLSQHFTRFSRVTDLGEAFAWNGGRN
jgi:hypothetical protein